MFQETLPGLLPLREIKHKTEILGALPKPSPIYILSPLEDETLRNHLNNALNKNLNQVSKFPYGAAVFFVQKKDGSLRLVTDYCALNVLNIKKTVPSSAHQQTTGSTQRRQDIFKD